ncbi:MAG: fumarylacetoacetate hydrolase family protein [Chloroflexota bacterium]
MGNVKQLADSLVAAHADKQRFETLKLGDRALRVGEGYQVQDHFVSKLLSRDGGQVVGYKIGLTSKVMQQMCGIDAPIHGRILGSRLYASGAALRLSDFGRLGMEFEIAVQLSRDLDAVPDSVEAMADFVQAICPAIELVDDRAAAYEGLDAASLIADNSWNAGAVLGQWVAPPSDLQTRLGRVLVDGGEIDRALVGDALEHPFASVMWLASCLSTTEHRLKAGMIVMTGSIVKTRFPVESARWRYEVEDLGAVDVSIQMPI